MFDRQNVLNGRAIITADRTAHTQLHSKGWYKGMSEEHTPLLEKMLTDLKKQGFSFLDEFFNASELLNIQELKPDGKELTSIERGILKGMWR